MAEHTHSHTTAMSGPHRETESDPAVDTTNFPEIPGFQVLALLDHSDAGSVYLAQQHSLKRRVAIKVIDAGASVTPEKLERFREAARKVATVRHPGVCQIFETGQVDETPYLVMEYVQGQPLCDFIRKQVPQPQAAARILLQIAQAMAACHQAGVVHRNLRPSNVMVTERGTVKVMDFGLSHMLIEQDGQSHPGHALGPSGYLAPEQLGGDAKMGPECDIYAMGAILYEMLTGRSPFQSPDATQLTTLVLTADPIPPRSLQPQVPIDLETICLKCLEKSPGRRYRSAQALQEDVHRYLDDRPILAQRASPLARSWKWSRRRPVIAGLIAFGVLGTLTALAGTAIFVVQLYGAKNRSERLFQQGQELRRWLVNEHIQQSAELRGAGTVQSSLVNKTLEHLRALQREVATDAPLRDFLVDAYQRIAKVQSHPAYFTQQRYHQAIRSHEHALALLQDLPESEHSTDVLLQEGLILTDMSRLFEKIEFSEAARRKIDEAVDVLFRAGAADPNSGRVQLALLDAQEQQSKLQSQDEPPLQAFQRFSRLYEKAQTQSESATVATAESRTPWRVLLAHLARDLAKVVQTGQIPNVPSPLSSAAEYYRASVNQLEQAVNEIASYRPELAETLRAFARVLDQQGNAAEAEKVNRSAIKQYRRLVEEYPLSDVYLLDLLTAEQQFFDFLVAHQQQPQAVEVAQAHLRDAERLYLANAEIYRDLYLKSQLQLIEILRHQFRYDDALEHVRQAIELVSKRPTAQNSLDDQSNLAHLLTTQANLLVEQDHGQSTFAERMQSLTQAIAALNQAEDMYRSLDEWYSTLPGSLAWQIATERHALEEELEQLTWQSREAFPQSRNSL